VYKTRSTSYSIVLFGAQNGVLALLCLVLYLQGQSGGPQGLFLAAQSVQLACCPLYTLLSSPAAPLAFPARPAALQVALSTFLPTASVWQLECWQPVPVSVPV
jgi:hypothetical protein